MLTAIWVLPARIFKSVGIRLSALDTLWATYKRACETDIEKWMTQTPTTACIKTHGRASGASYRPHKKQLFAQLLGISGSAFRCASNVDPQSEATLFVFITEGEHFEKSENEDLSCLSLFSVPILSFGVLNSALFSIVVRSATSVEATFDAAPFIFFN